MRLNSFFNVSASMASAFLLVAAACTTKDDSDIAYIGIEKEIPVEFERVFPKTMIIDKEITPEFAGVGGPSKFFAFFGTKLPAKFYDDFCKENAEECPETVRLPVAVEYDDNGKNILVYVNDYVNRRMRYKADEDLSTEWTLPRIIDGEPLVGDCEEHALLKRSILRNFIPEESMFLVNLVTEVDRSHIVLAVRTSEGDVLLDNRFSTLLKPDAMARDRGYKYMVATKPGDSKNWYYTHLPENDFDARLKREYSRNSFKVSKDSILIAGIMRKDPSSQVANNILGNIPNPGW